MSLVRILPIVKASQVLKMVNETHKSCRRVNGRFYLADPSTPVVPAFLMRRHSVPHDWTPPEAA